jgi:DNA mismatch repair ATPase MutS
LIVPDALYGRLSQHMHLVNIEIYDESHLLVRPVWSQKLIVLRRKIYELRAEESSFEKDVLRRISEQIATAGGELQRLCEILGRLDCALAKAELAVKYGMTRPKIADELTVRQGRLLSLEQECGENGREYTPLNVSLSDKGALLYGSNMGGKTVVMRTIAFLQLLTQCGFFVPAGGFVTRIYRSLQFVGANERRSFKGLSSFGCEVWEMQEKWAQGEFPRFFVIDEFAATTNAREATALSNALLYELHREPGTYYLMATHYVDKRHEVKDLKIWHMQGIDHHKLQSLRDAFDAASTLTEKVRLLTSCMVYRINEESSLVKDEEALMIAQLLGFNPNILARAKSYLEN